MERADNGREGDSRDCEIESDRFQIELLDCFAGLSVGLWQKRTQGLEPLAASGLIRRIADQQTQIRLQTAIDCALKRESQRCRRYRPCRNAALELALLASHCESGQESQGRSCKSHSRRSQREGRRPARRI